MTLSGGAPHGFSPRQVVTAYSLATAQVTLNQLRIGHDLDQSRPLKWRQWFPVPGITVLELTVEQFSENCVAFVVEMDAILDEKLEALAIIVGKGRFQVDERNVLF